MACGARALAGAAVRLDSFATLGNVMPSRPPSRPSSRPRLMLAGALALALLLAQALGAWHRIAHAPGLAVPAAPDAHDRHGLFDDHEADGDACRLIDQLSHADAVPATALAGPDAAPAWQPAAAADGRAASGPCSAYLARAPPPV
jgi:hypothetical protein